MGFFSDLGKALSGGGGGNSNGGSNADRRRQEDRAANQPSYGGASIRGLTSSDPANVARNQAAAKMYSDLEKNKPESKDKPEKPAAAPAAPSAPAAPVTPPVVPPTLTPPGAPAPVGPGDAPISAVEAAAIESTKGGRESTILTSALGLLADQEAQGLLRPRRSLMSGGMIK
jgi:hypothetical protein